MSVLEQSIEQFLLAELKTNFGRQVQLFRSLLIEAVALAYARIEQLTIHVTKFKSQ